MSGISSRSIEKITEDDAFIAQALKDASIPTLMMSMIHMTGDSGLLESDKRPLAVYLNEVQGFMSEDDKAAIREQALEVIKTYRDNDCQLPPNPDHDTIRKMMSFMVAEEVPEDYVPLMLEEMRLENPDPRGNTLSLISEEDKAGFPVVIVGGGMSGILAAIRLKQAGIPFTVIEKNPAVGGTWYENQYPGCRVDVGNHFYCYSFEPNTEWTQFYARQPELQAYFEACIDKYQLRDHFKFDTEVTSMSYNEEEGQWDVVIHHDSQVEVLRARSVVSAVGFLNRPKMPDIEGVGCLNGAEFHSARWDHSQDLTGKRVAVIGSGASAFQLVPEIAKMATSVKVFQRTAPWMFPNENYHAEVSEGKKWCLKHLPLYIAWYRFLLFWPATDGLLPSLKVDPVWDQKNQSINETNEMVRQVFTDWISGQCGDDEELRKKVIPDYVPLGTRTLQDNGSWLAALQRDNVELITEPIERINTGGIVTAGDHQHDVDIVIYATGFKANKFLWPMKITGRNGVNLADQWGDEPQAYLGITVPGFPNLFCMYGPATNLAFGGSLIFNGECQMSYILASMDMLLTNGQLSMEVKTEVHDDYNQKLQNEISDMVWLHPSIKSSYYLNGSRQVRTLSPWRLLDYWRWTKTPVASDYDWR
ncbi:MAG: NAD(P)-binding domain-containing protein [Pseudomonadales bacterium]